MQTVTDLAGGINSPIYSRSTCVHFAGTRHRLAMFHIGRWDSGIIICRNSTFVWKRKCQTTTTIYNIWFQDVASRYTQAKLTYIQESYGAFDVYSVHSIPLSVVSCFRELYAEYVDYFHQNKVTSWRSNADCYWPGWGHPIIRLTAGQLAYILEERVTDLQCFISDVETVE